MDLEKAKRRRLAAYKAANRNWPTPLEELMFTDKYNKNPDRVFVLLKTITIEAGTKFTRAPWERGGLGNVEGVVGLGKHATAYLNLPLRVVEIDAAEWFTETEDEGGVGRSPAEKEEEEAWFEETTDEK